MRRKMEHLREEMEQIRLLRQVSSAKNSATGSSYRIVTFHRSATTFQTLARYSVCPPSAAETARRLKESWTSQNVWRCAVASGAKASAADPLSPVKSFVDRTCLFGTLRRAYDLGEFASQVNRLNSSWKPFLNNVCVWQDVLFNTSKRKCHCLLVKHTRE